MSVCIYMCVYGVCVYNQGQDILIVGWDFWIYVFRKDFRLRPC